jgi:hypothetical protein
VRLEDAVGEKGRGVVTVGTGSVGARGATSGTGRGSERCDLCDFSKWTGMKDGW